MKSKQAFFFATLSDITPILKSMDEIFPANYYRVGLFDEKNTQRYKSALELPDLGSTPFGDWNYTSKFLVMPQEQLLTIREVPQRAGGLKYAIDQALNPISVIISLGGKHQTKEDILVAGKIGTITDTLFSLDYFKKFVSQLRKFKKVGSFYVGKEAEEKLRNGWRLVTDDGRPKEYDLKLGV